MNPPTDAGYNVFQNLKYGEMLKGARTFVSVDGVQTRRGLCYEGAVAVSAEILISIGTDGRRHRKRSTTLFEQGDGLGICGWCGEYTADQ
jgi:hypothetical protein